MGSCSISLTVQGNLRSDVEEALRIQRQEDSRYNGHQEGYSGDWQTIRDINYVNETFVDEKEAYEYCLKNSKKWEATAVKVYKDLKVNHKELIKIGKKIAYLNKKLSTLEGKYRDWLHSTWAKRAPVVAKAKTCKCNNCKSTINMEYNEPISSFQGPTTYTCPVCRRGMLTAAQLKRSDKYQDDIKALKLEVENTRKNYRSTEVDLKNKSVNSSTKTYWLVAGWAAC